jgi:Tfp pilus assembly protein FimT
MRADIDKTNRSRTFTIVELLTLMSITAILVSLLVPTLNETRRHSYGVKTESAAERHRDWIGVFNAELKILSPKET